MNRFQIPPAYRLINRSELAEIGLEGIVLEHIRSGARLICMPAEDDNKVFYIAFRTPPVDDSGLPHILEHSVLCGSDKYPIKDPFMELNKSSLNTFLNAMTYPDKTIYPVASCNDKDFANLMDVYLDAVFHPLIHRNKNIFLQEGWRYELDSPEGELRINGVVYSEMKGAFSNPEECLMRYSLNSLFPDTAYGFESGGDPACIPTLSYEAFCDFHKKLYHPSNSYIFLYGNMDMEERLSYLDRAYLKDYEQINIDSALRLQKPFAKRRDLNYTYPIGAEEDPSQKSFYSLQWVVGDVEDSLLSNAFDVLETVLMNAPGAPLKQALLDAGLAKDAGGGYMNDMRQTVFNLIAKEGKAGERERFLQVVTDCLRKVVREGLNPRSLKAAISLREFQRREADYGGLSKGLIYGITLLETGWLHGGTDPFASLRFEKDFAYLRDHIQEGYFESLIEKYLLNNPHCSLIEMNPERGGAEKEAAAIKEKLAAYKTSLSLKEQQALVKQYQDLKAYQETEDSPQDIAKVPKLSKSDIKRKIRPAVNLESEAGPAKLVYRHSQTAGIAYASFFFELENLPGEHLPWLGLLRACFASVSTEKQDYKELFDTISETTGGLSISLQTPVRLSGEWTPYAVVTLKALYDKWDQSLRLLKEICLESVFDDSKRIFEIISETLINLKQSMITAGHSAAVRRAASYSNEPSLFAEITGGLDFLRFLTDLSDHYEERKQEIASTLKELSREVFTREGLLINLSCEEDGFLGLRKGLTDFSRSLPSDPEKRFKLEKSGRKNEGIKTTGGVGFTACCGSYREAGPYVGSLRVLKTILGTDYLWQQLRVLGGAYGAMCQFNSSGASYFVSYRDPNIRSTVECFRRIPAWLRNLELSQEALDSFIISTIGGLDFPYTPSVQGSLDFSMYLIGADAAFQQAERDAILDCRPEDLRALVPYMEAILHEGNLCTFGSSVKIEEEKDLFQHIENL